MALLGFLLFFTRRPSALLEPSLWAEDGSVFLRTILYGDVGLFESYNGAVYVVQRLAAAAAALFPLSAQALLYAAAAGVLAVASVAWVLSDRCRLLGPLPVRAVLFLGLLLIPQASETAWNLTNVHWWMAVGLVTVGLLDPATSRWGAATEIVFVLVVSMTGFSALLAVPALIARVLRNRDRQSVVLAVIAGTSLGVQLLTLMSHPRPSESSWRIFIDQPSGVGGLVLKRLFGALVLGEAGLRESWTADERGWWPVLAATALLLLTSVAVVAGASRDVVAVLVSGAIGVVAGVWTVGPDLTPLLDFGGWRYFLGGLACVCMALVMIAVNSPRSVARFASVGALILMLPGFIADFRLPDRRAADMAGFQACVEGAAPACALRLNPESWYLVYDRDADAYEVAIYETTPPRLGPNGELLTSG